MQCIRRDEPVATDTVYSDTPAIGNGATTAQFFVGTKSLVCDVYPMKTDKQFVNVLLDNIRRRGAMTKLISDRAQVEISNKVQDILRNLMIADWQSEPHQQHQNPAVRRFQDIKRLTNTLLDRTGTPPSLWLLAMSYACCVLNHTVNASIGYAVPLTLLTGITQDISPLIQFEWYEAIYYREEEVEFPSKSRESLGWFVGISEHVGHALTYLILTEDTNKILHRLVVCTAIDVKSQNLRANGPSKQDPHQVVRSCLDDKIEALGDGETPEAIHMPIVHPEELVGRSFKMPTDTGQMQHIRIVEARSVTGIIHMFNATPIDWYSKKQATMETATYGSEFVAARTCVEQIVDLRNTLRYLGVPIQERSYMFGDNESVVNLSTTPHAKLHKRHTAL